MNMYLTLPALVGYIDLDELNELIGNGAVEGVEVSVILDESLLSLGVFLTLSAVRELLTYLRYLLRKLFLLIT